MAGPILALTERVDRFSIDTNGEQATTHREEVISILSGKNEGEGSPWLQQDESGTEKGGDIHE